jgi:hypothetical protein
MQLEIAFGVESFTLTQEYNEVFGIHFQKLQIRGAGVSGESAHALARITI